MLPSNVKYLADYISPNVDIQETVIHFKPKTGEVLLKVPIETPDQSIVITLSTNSSHLNKYKATLRISVHDSNGMNSHFIVGAADYDKFPPCDHEGVESADNPLVSEGTEAPSTFKFIFLPWERLGYCETAQEGGYTNVGKFRTLLNRNEPLHLELSSSEEGYINYISIKSI